MLHSVMNTPVEPGPCGVLNFTQAESGLAVVVMLFRELGLAWLILWDGPCAVELPKAVAQFCWWAVTKSSCTFIPHV